DLGGVAELKKSGGPVDSGMKRGGEFLLGGFGIELHESKEGVPAGATVGVVESGHDFRDDVPGNCGTELAERNQCLTALQNILVFDHGGKFGYSGPGKLTLSGK